MPMRVKPKRPGKPFRKQKVTVTEYVEVVRSLNDILARQVLLVLAIVLAVVFAILMLLLALGIAHLPTRALFSIISICTLVIEIVVLFAYKSYDK